MSKNNWSKFVNCIAFIGLIIISVCLIMQRIFNSQGELTRALGIIGQAIAYLITAISAFFYVRTKRNVWWYVAYTVAAVLVVVFMVILVLV